MHAFVYTAHRGVFTVYAFLYTVNTGVLTVHAFVYPANSVVLTVYTFVYTAHTGVFTDVVCWIGLTTFFQQGTMMDSVYVCVYRECIVHRCANTVYRCI